MEFFVVSILTDSACEQK